MTSAAYRLSVPKFVVFAFQLMEKELSQVQSQQLCPFDQDT